MTDGGTPYIVPFHEDISAGGFWEAALQTKPLNTEAKLDGSLFKPIHSFTHSVIPHFLLHSSRLVPNIYTLLLVC